jgi:ABC-type sugar transport system ATPase subunit
MQHADDLLRITGLTKAYAGVSALSDVSLNLIAGEVHALCGENGAGKSTLIKCLTGVTTPDSGKIEIDGRTLAFGSTWHRCHSPRVHDLS